MFGNKKEKKQDNVTNENVTNDNKSKNKKGSAKSEEEAKNVNTNKIKIKIFRYIGEDLAVQIGKSIIAEEKKDENNNLLVINTDASLKEDLNFSIDRVYEIMNFSLRMQNKTKSEKQGILRTAIKLQEDLVISIEEDKKLNEKYNFRDEELKLKQLKIFYDSLRKEKRGNYMRLGEGGVRTYEFVSIDGILYPYFFGSKRFRVYPDLLVKKKIFNHENTIFKNENIQLFNSTMNWILVVLYICAIFLLVAEVGAGYYVYQKNADIEMKINEGSVTCLNTLGMFTKNYGSTLESYMREKQKQISETPKTKNNINSEIPIINIDPGNLVNNNK